MSNLTFSRVLQDLRKHKDAIDVVVLYHGGEPQLNKNFFDWTHRVREIKPEIFIKSVTNGMLLNQQNIEKTVLSSLDLIEISLDGTGPKDNELIRKNSNSGKVVKNIKGLISARNNAGSNSGLQLVPSQFYEGATKEISPRHVGKKRIR